MPPTRDPSVLLAAARLYYVENRSQAEIATELGTSRSNVSRLTPEREASSPALANGPPRSRSATSVLTSSSFTPST